MVKLTGIKKTVTDIKQNCNSEYFIYLNTTTNKVSGGCDQFFPRDGIYLIMQGVIHIHGIPTMHEIENAAMSALKN